MPIIFIGILLDKIHIMNIHYIHWIYVIHQWIIETYDGKFNTWQCLFRSSSSLTSNAESNPL